MLAALGLLVGLMPPSSSPPVDLRWDAVPSCEQSTRVRARLDDLLDQREGPGGTAVVLVTEHDDGWRATVEIEAKGASVRRVLEGRPCATLADAVALIIAVTVDPMGMGDVVPSPVSSTPELDPGETVVPSPEISPARVESPVSAVGARLESAPSQQASADASPRPAPSSRARRTISTASVFVEGGGALGLVPGVGLQLGGGLTLSSGDARFVAAGAHGVARAVEHPEGIDAGADLWSTSGRALACWSPGRTRLSVAACGGVEAGSYAARGFGLERSATVRTAWVAAIPRAQVTLWATRRLGLSLAAEAPVALVRPRFSIDDFAADLVRVGPAGLRMGLAIEVIFFDESKAGRARRGSG